MSPRKRARSANACLNASASTCSWAALPRALARQVDARRIARRQDPQRLDQRDAARRRRRHRTARAARDSPSRPACGRRWRSSRDPRPSSRRPRRAPPRRSPSRSRPCRTRPVPARSLPSVQARSGRRQVSPACSGLAAKRSMNARSSDARSSVARLPARRDDTGKPFAASFCAGSTQRRNGSLPHRRTISPSPRTSPGTATASPPRWDSSGHGVPVLQVRGGRDRRGRALAGVERVHLLLLGDVHQRERAAADPG